MEEELDELSPCGGGRCAFLVEAALADTASVSPPTPELLRHVAGLLHAQSQRAALAVMSVVACARRLEAFAHVQATELATAREAVEAEAAEDAALYRQALAEGETQTPEEWVMYKTRGHAFRAAAMFACLFGLPSCSEGDTDDAKTEPAKIVGKWGLELNDGCVVGFVAQAEGLYESDIICPLEGGAFGVEAELGRYFTMDSQLAMTPTHATCATSDHSADTILFNVDRDTLTLIFPDGALIMERIPDSPGGTAVLRYGCMDVDAGLFTQGELQPL